MTRLRGNAGLAALTDFLSLFAGRVGGILVTLFFIPQYNRLLGAEVFGAVAVILSLQSFFLVSDLGLATLISRDTAIARDDPAKLTAAVWMRRRAETILALLALAIATLAVLLPLIGLPVPWSLAKGLVAAMITALITMLVGTNILQLSLNALGRYRAGAGLSVAGALARGVATVLVLRVMPSLSAFLQAQVVMSALHFAAGRWLLERGCTPLHWRERLLERDAVLDLLRRCIPLTFYTLAGAAAVNLDKSIISAFISLKTAGAYFLATTYALVPVAILSGPVNSYFAPRIAHAHHAGDAEREYHLALVFQLVLMCAVAAPSLSLAVQLPDWFWLWLHDAAQSERSRVIGPILLAGGALSATGYYPTTYLIAAEDTRYLAGLSLVTAAGVLIAAPVFAARLDLTGVAWSYFAFYAAGFVGLWLRVGSMLGWAKIARFLFLSYLLPSTVICLVYAVLYRLFVGYGVPQPVLLLGPVAFAGAMGMVACAIIFARARGGQGWTRMKERP